MKFTMKNRKLTFILGMIIILFFIILMTLSALFEPEFFSFFQIVITLFVMIPLIIIVIFAKRFSVFVDGTTITVQKAFAWKSFTIDVSEITKIVSNGMVMKVYTNSGKKFNIEWFMINSEKMYDFINKNVEKDKIQTKFISFANEVFPNIIFGPYAVRVDVNVNKENLLMVHKKIEDLCKNSQTILEDIYSNITYLYNKIVDENSAFIDIDFVKENYYFDIFACEYKTGEIFINFVGNLSNGNGGSLLDDKAFVTMINIITGEVTHDILEKDRLIQEDNLII